jgi:hypothetical protein
MGFDLGMALGGAVKTGVDTYTKLQEEDRLDKAEQRATEADKRTAEQFEWQRKDQAGKQALQTAASNVANMGDTQNVPDQAAMANPQGAYQQYEGADGPVTPTQAVPISAKDKQKMFVQQALNGGANPLDVMNYQKGSLELKALNKQADREDQFDEGMKKIQDQSVEHLKIAASGNGKELVKIANKEGLDVKEKQNKDGTITYEYYEDGKLAKTFNDVNELAHAGNELLLTHWMKTDGVKLLGSPAAVGTYLASQKKEKQEDKKIDILQQNADSTKALVPSEMAKNFGAAYASGEAGKYYGAHAKSIGDKNAREQDLYDTQKSFSDKIAALDPKAPDYATKKYEIAQQGEAALAMKSGDFSKIAAGTPMGQAMTSYHEAEKAFNEGKTAVKPNQASFIANAGFAPEGVQKDFKTRYEAALANNKSKEATAIADEYRSKYKYTPIDFPEASVKPTAIPDKTNTTTSKVVNTNGAIPTNSYKYPEGSPLQGIDNYITKALTPAPKGPINK